MLNAHHALEVSLGTNKFVFRVSTPHFCWKLICTDINTDVSLSEALVKWGISLKCSTEGGLPSHTTLSLGAATVRFSALEFSMFTSSWLLIFLKYKQKIKLIKYLSSLSTSDNKFTDCIIIGKLNPYVLVLG